MKPFLAEKRRLIDLLVLFFLSAVIYFVWDSWPMICLFCFGFIWNWTAAQDLSLLMENPRYRFSMVRFVGNLQLMILKPVLGLPRWTHVFVKTLPAGIFWGMVVVINDSLMPWWMTFAGSFAFELLQIEKNLLRKEKESVL